MLTPLRRIVTLTMVALSITLAVPGNAASAYEIRGTIRDAFGSPISGATVSDGAGKTSLTDSEGRFSFGENIPHEYRIQARKTGFTTTFSTHDVDDALAGRELEMTMLYVGIEQVRPWSINPSFSQTLTFEVRSLAPANSCFEWQDITFGTRKNMEVVETEGSWSTWRLTHTVPADLIDGPYWYEITGRDCSTGTVAVWTASGAYIIDRVAPAALSPYPSGWAPAGNLRALLRDSDKGGGVDSSASIEASLDGGEWVEAIRYGYYSGAEFPLPVSPGDHSVQVRLVDHAGNLGVSTFTFKGDVDAPVISSPAPVGTILDPSPEISAVVSDNDSGVDIASIEMILSAKSTQGLGKWNDLPVSYEASSGRVWYKIPSIPDGTSFGQYPLLNGTYEVTLEVTDIAGNVTKSVWSFTVVA